MAKKKYRVLVACTIAGIGCIPDQVINLEEKLGKQHAGELDGHKDAVGYALSVNGGNVTDIGSDEPEHGNDPEPAAGE